MSKPLNVLVWLMRRQLRFVAILCVIFSVVLLKGDGASWTNIAIVSGLSLMVLLFAALVWFWATVLTGKTEPPASPTPASPIPDKPSHVD